MHAKNVLECNHLLLKVGYSSFHCFDLSTGFSGNHVDMFLLNGMVQTTTARQCILSETSKTSGKRHCVAVPEYIRTMKCTWSQAITKEHLPSSCTVPTKNFYLFNLEELARY